jgi:nucleotide-binding universal stress UspA family protein
MDRRVREVVLISLLAAFCGGRAWRGNRSITLASRLGYFTVTKEKAIDTRRSGAELAKYLARHSVDVVLDEVDAKGRSIGDVFEAHVTYRHANLLVMGAYGHSRVREFVLGGATKTMLARPPVPIFLSH